MSWAFGTWSVRHALPLGVFERAAEGEFVEAGDVLAAGTAVSSTVRVQGAKRLGISPDELGRITRYPVGAQLRRGSVLARAGRRFARAATSPIAGHLVHVSREGDFFVAPMASAWTVRSTIDGVVERSRDADVAVSGRCWALSGIAAYGPDAVGLLAMGVDAPVDELRPSRIDVRSRDRILVGGARMAAEAMTRAHACGVAGLVAGAAPAGGLRVVFGDDVRAAGAATRDDRPTVLCLLGFGTAPIPLEMFAPLVALTGSRAAIHTASARLFAFAPPDADFAAAPHELALADDYSGVRPLQGATESGGEERFASEVIADAVRTAQGPIPVANVRPSDAPR